MAMWSDADEARAHAPTTQRTRTHGARTLTPLPCLSPRGPSMTTTTTTITTMTMIMTVTMTTTMTTTIIMTIIMTATMNIVGWVEAKQDAWQGSLY